MNDPDDLQIRPLWRSFCPLYGAECLRHSVGTAKPFRSEARQRQQVQNGFAAVVVHE